MATAEHYLYAVLADDTEIFGTRAFPFIKDSVRAAVCSVAGERRVLTEPQCRVMRVMHPADTPGLPSETLWQQANEDALIRAAVKESCGI